MKQKTNGTEASDSLEWHSHGSCICVRVSAAKHIKTSLCKWAATRKIMSALIILIFPRAFSGTFFSFLLFLESNLKKKTMNSFQSSIQNELLFF